MDVNMIRTRLLEVLREKNLRPTELAKRIKKKHPDIEFGHQFVLNIANGRNKRRIDLNKWRYVLEELEMTQAEFNMQSPANLPPANVDNMILLLGAVQAMGSFVLDSRRDDPQLVCLTSWLIDASRRVSAGLSTEQSEKVKARTAEIRGKCDASSKGAESGS